MELLDRSCKLKKISLRGLYGFLNYDIDFENDKNLSVLIGKNGFGKSSILKLINGLTDKNSPFREMVFKKPIFSKLKADFLIDGNDERVVEISNVSSSRSTLRYQFAMSSLNKPDAEETKVPLLIQNILSKKGEKELFMEYPEFVKSFLLASSRLKSDSELQFISSIFQNVIKESGLSQEKKNQFLKEFKTSSGANEVIDDFLSIGEDNFRTFSSSLRRLACGVPSNLYSKSDRLCDLAAFFVANDLFTDFNSSTSSDFMKTYSTKEALTCVSKIKRIVLQHDERFQKALHNYFLIKKAPTGAHFINDNSGVGNRKGSRFLSNYYGSLSSLRRFSKEITKCASFIKNIELLKLIFNDVFSDSFAKYRLGVSPTDGFYLTVDQKTRLSLDILPSGELNCLFVFYYLLFHGNEKGIFLLDEPEISFHIEWQEKIIEQIMEIQNKNGGWPQVIIATHSPFILHDNFDLLAKVTYVNND